MSVINTIIENFANNRLFDQLKKCDIFLIFSIVLGLLIQLKVLGDRITMAFDKSVSTQIVALDTSRAFGCVFD